MKAGTSMTESLNLTVDRRDGLAVIYTEGYINNQGGEEIARAAYKLLDEGFKVLLLNLAGTKIVNSIGISILIEIIEKMIEIDGKLGFCCLTPTIDKTFHIMGLAQYAPIFDTEERALAELGELGQLGQHRD
jgi:stage II sporulation protein AA (anti-sigma F factor antagonist)